MERTKRCKMWFPRIILQGCDFVRDRNAAACAGGRESNALLLLLTCLQARSRNDICTIPATAKAWELFQARTGRKLKQ